MPELLVQNDPSIERRRQLSRMLLAQGQQQGPVHHWSQGLAKILASGFGAYQGQKADQAEEKQRQQFSQAFTQAMGSDDPQRAMAQVLAQVDPAAAAKVYSSYQEQQADANNIGGVGKYNPRDYTVKSWSKFINSRDPSVLERYESQKNINIGGVPHTYDPSTGGYFPAQVGPPGGQRPGGQGPGGPSSTQPPKPVTTADVAGSEAEITGAKEGAKQRAQTEAGLEADIFPAFNSTEYSMVQSAQASDTAKELLEHPGFDAAFGFGGETASKIPGTQAADAKALLDQLKNRTFITALQAMREASKTGGAVGNVSEQEGARFENAFNALQQAQSPEQARREMQNLVRIMEEGQRRVKRAFQLQYGNTQGFDRIFGELPEVGAQSARRSRGNNREPSIEDLVNQYAQ